jgi:hypothetical protein
MDTLKKKLLIIWLVTTAIAVTLSLLFNVFVGLGISVLGLVILLFYMKKNEIDNIMNAGMNESVNYKCLNCGNISGSSHCNKCGSKVSKFYI